MRQKSNFLGDLIRFYAKYRTAVILCQFDLSIVFFNEEAACIFPDMKVGDPLKRALGEAAGKEAKTAHIFYLNDRTPCMIHPLADPLGGLYYVVEVQADPQDKILFGDRRFLTFLSHLSHEIGTPLTLLCSSLSLIQRYSGQDNEKADQYIKAAIGYYYRLSRLVSHFLALSDLYKEGRPALQTRTVDMVSFVKTLRDAFVKTDRTDNTPVEFVSNVSECLCDIDPFLIERVLLNLLYNACKYANEEDNAVTVTVGKQNGWALLSVSDKGVGLDTEIAEALTTDKEFPLDRSGLPGHGIGLQIVKFYVSLHGGRIEADRGRGGGTVIRIYLPLSGTSPSLKNPYTFDIEHFLAASLEEGG